MPSGMSHTVPHRYKIDYTYITEINYDNAGTGRI